MHKRRHVETHQIRVTGILDRHDSDSVQFTGGCSEVDVGSFVVVDRGLGTATKRQDPNSNERGKGLRLQHGVVLNLGLSEGRTVSGDEDELGYGMSALNSEAGGVSVLTFAVSQLLQGLLVSEGELLKVSILFLQIGIFRWSGLLACPTSSLNPSVCHCLQHPSIQDDDSSPSRPEVLIVPCLSILETLILP